MTEPSRASPTARRWGLQAKLILSMLLVGVVPLLVGLGMAFWQGSREIREVNGESFKALATEAARKLDVLVAEEVARTSRIATDPLVVREMEQRRDALRDLTDPARRAALAEARRRWEAKEPAAVKSVTDNKLSRLLRDHYTGSHSLQDELLPQVVRAATRMLYVTDQDGTLVAAITDRPAFSNESEDWWVGAYNKGVGQLYVEDVSFEPRADTYVFSISLPIMDSLRYEVVGVIRRVIDAKEFFSPSTHPIRFGKTGHVMLIDSRGIVISCPVLPTGVSLSDMDLIPLVTPLQPGWVTAPSDGHGGHATSIIGFAPLPETSRATNGSMERGAWHTFVWQSSDELFAPIQHLFTWMLVFGLVAVGLLASLGYLAATRIVTPVRALQRAAQSIGRGELRDPIRINTGDELEDLAEEFNRMNSQLESAFAGLTDQVKLKTQEVQDLQRSTDEILDAVPTPIFMVDEAGTVHYVNRAARTAFGLEQDRATEVPLFALLPAEEAAQAKVRRELADVGTRPLPAGAGRLLPARDPLAPEITARDAGRHELQIGQRLYQYQWFHLTGRPGDVRRIGLVLRDTTDDSRLQDQLIQAEKSGSLGLLTAGIGHELNNPLFGIVGLGEAIQDEADLPRIKAYARDIVAQGRRMAAIIRDFTGVASREASGQRIPVHLEAELDQALATVQVGLDTNDLVIRREYAGGTRVSALPEQLRQALTNVLMNAVQAMKGNGLLRIGTGVADGFAVATITDTGPGIPKQHLSRIFDPFFTTKGQGEGSGLGLTIARRIIRTFGGDIRIESHEGRGTSCVITLPLVDGPPGAPEDSWNVTQPHSASQASRSSP